MNKLPPPNDSSWNDRLYPSFLPSPFLVPSQWQSVEPGLLSQLSRVQVPTVQTEPGPGNQCRLHLQSWGRSMTKRCTGLWVASAFQAPADSVRGFRWGRRRRDSTRVLKFRLLWLCSCRHVVKNITHPGNNTDLGILPTWFVTSHLSALFIAGNSLDLWEPHVLIGKLGS